MTTQQNERVLDEVNEALREHVSGLKDREGADSARQKAERVGVILRYAGAASLITSSIVLLFQQWGGADHIWRYLCFLLFTVVTGAAGLFCGLTIKESKGARLLLAFVTGIACVHASQLGALLYSIYGARFADYPALLLWQAPSEFSAWLCVSAGAAVMVPFMYLGYSALDRRLANILTLLAVIANGSILLPFRDPAFVAVAAIVLTGLFLAVERYANISFGAHTRETRLAQLSLLLPLGVLVGRQGFLYGFDEMCVAAALGSAALLVGWLAPVEKNPSLASFAHFASFALGSTAWFILARSQGLTETDYAFSLVGLPLAVIAMTLSMARSPAAPRFENLAALLLVAAPSLDLVYRETILTSAVQLTTSIGILTWACLAERRKLLVIGASGVALGLYQHVVRALLEVSVSPWLVLGIAGIATVIGASYIEKNFVKIQAQVKRTRLALREWQA